jgi:hypothetical protein
MPRTSMSSRAALIGNNLTYWASAVNPPWAGLLTLTFIFNGYADARRAKHVKKQFYKNWTWTSDKEKTSPHPVATPSMQNFDDCRILSFTATKKHLEQTLQTWWRTRHIVTLGRRTFKLQICRRQTLNFCSKAET